MLFRGNPCQGAVVKIFVNKPKIPQQSFTTIVIRSNQTQFCCQLSILQNFDTDDQKIFIWIVSLSLERRPFSAKNICFQYSGSWTNFMKFV